MNKKYELVQDIKQPNDHNYKAGEIFTKKNKDENSAYLSSDERRAFHPCIVENNPTWFKEIVSEPKIEVDLFQGLVDSKTNYSSDKGYYNKYYLHIYNCKLSNEQHSLIKEAIEKILNPNTSTPTSELVEDKKDVDWEIIEFDYEGKGVNIIELRNDGKYYYQSPKGSLSGTLQVHIKNPAWLIRRVKRLSDKQYFHVGDTISQGRITGFHIEENIMVVEFEGNSRQSDLNLVSKLTSTPMIKK